MSDYTELIAAARTISLAPGATCTEWLDALTVVENLADACEALQEKCDLLIRNRNYLGGKVEALQAERDKLKVDRDLSYGQGWKDASDFARKWLYGENKR